MKILIFKKGLFTIAVTLFSIFLASCEPIPPDDLSGSQKPYMAKLVNVNWNNQSATQSQLNDVQVIRNNQRIPTRYKMDIHSGDRITTNSATTVFLVYNEGSKVMINTNTDVLLRNPKFKIFLLALGEVFLEVKSRFEVIEEFGSLVNDGTRYLVSKRRNGLSVVVFDGRVSVNSNLARKPNWSGILLTKGDKVTRGSSRRLGKIRPLTDADKNYVKSWTEPLKRNFPNAPPKKDDVSSSKVPWDTIIGKFIDEVIDIKKNKRDSDDGSARQPPNTRPPNPDPNDSEDDVKYDPTGLPVPKNQPIFK